MLSVRSRLKTKALHGQRGQAKVLQGTARPLCLVISGELDHLESTGVLERVDHSKWAAPVVTVSKKDGGEDLWGL